MDTIRNYLDHMFFGLPQSQNLKRAKEELLSMMEDKYYELKAAGKSENEAIGIVISEFGNLEEVSEVLGIQEETESKEDYLEVGLDKAQEFYEINKITWPKIAFGVMLCIVSVTSIFLMLALQRLGVISLSEDHAAIIGVSFMFFFIAAGALHFIKYPIQPEGFKNLYREKLKLSYEAKHFISEKRSADSGNYRSSLSLSVALYVLAVVPVIIVGGIFDDSNEGYVLLSLIAMFWIIGFATFTLIKAVGRAHVSKVLLQEDDYSIKKKNATKKLGKIEDVYWLSIVVIYLLWSFSSMNWGFTWIIWPIAGLIYVIIEFIVGEE